MAVYNQLMGCPLACPRCGARFVGTVYLGFGWRTDILYRVGDVYRWNAGPPSAGGRPEGQHVAGYGFSTCTSCNKDFDARVILDGDVLIGAEPDLLHVPDEPDEMVDLKACPHCGSTTAAELVCVRNYQLARILCSCDISGFQILLQRPFVPGEQPVLIGTPLPWVLSSCHSL